MTPTSDWQQLPFDEIWIVDFEFYPGPGKRAGGRDGGRGNAALPCRP